MRPSLIYPACQGKGYSMDATALALCMTAFDFGVVYADLVLPEHQATAWDDRVIAIADELAAIYTGQDD